MNINWKKTVLILFDTVIAVYLVLAITAFNRPEVSAKCTGVKTDIETSVIDGFLTPDEIKKILVREKLYPLSVPLADVSPRSIEEALQKSPFVEKTECYKTPGGQVCIRIRQRIPVVKIMTDNGENYYVDSQSNFMPENRYVTDLIVATGHISRKYAQTYLVKVANKLMEDKFWQNQIVQINVLSDGAVELVPRVGDHILYLGMPVHIDKKLERLRKFYLYGLNTAGWNLYSYINVEFDNQIICKKKKK